MRAAIAGGILASATPDRDDRLYPGDVGQFRYGGCGLAFGAAGVMIALEGAGVAVPDGHVDWLVRVTSAAQTPQLGLYDGLHGIAYALDRLGRTAAALEVLDRAVARHEELRAATLFGGLAGAGLNLLHFGRQLGDRTLLEHAHAIGQRIGDRLHDAERADLAPITRPGLLHGWTGPALLFLRLYEDDGDPRWLDEAGAALRRDCAQISTLPDGRAYVAEQGIVRPFLGTGSAGLGLVLEQYLAYRESDDLAAHRVGLHSSCRPELVTEPGLFDGRAGLLLYVGQVDDPAGRVDRQTLVDRHVRRFGWHAVPVEGGIGFPGRALLRLSTDLATGAAGVLLALESARSRRAALPFLDGAVQLATIGRR